MLAALLPFLALMTPHIELNASQLAAVAAGEPSLAWRGEDPAQAFSGPPLATLGTPKDDPSAQIWAAVDANALHLHIEVHDTQHLNANTGTQIWDGDSVQISIDARGHGAAGLATDADFVAIGDMYAVFALTDKDGAQSWAHLRGAPDAPGALVTPSRIVRDAARSVTVYDLALPWDMLHTIPAAFDALGLGVQINDADPNRPTQEHLRWGGGASGTLRPGLLHSLKYQPPPLGYVDFMVSRTNLWAPGDTPEIIVVNHAAAPTHLQSAWASNDESLTLAPAPQAARILVHPSDAPWTVAPQAWHVQLQRDDNAPGRAQQILVQAPPLSFATVTDQFASLAARATDVHLEQHVRAVASVVQQAWHSGLTLLPNNPEQALDALHTAQHLLPKLTQDCNDDAAYRRGQHALVGAAISPDDGTLQPYSVRLPRHWDPNKPHPLIVFLHGKGDPQVTHFIDNAVTQSADPEDDALVMLPWGRGIYGYRGLAENDVLVALEQVRERFKIDPNRIYLGGFSMGGAGAWNLALHVPAPWAAVAISSGGTWLTSLGVGLGGNTKDLPLQIWHGDADGSVDVSEAYAMRDELKRSGITPNVTIAHGAGHIFDDSRWRSMVQWLLPNRRGPQRSFSYVCDDFVHRGRNGVRMRRDTLMAPFPKVRVRIDGSRVQLDSQGAPGLDVELGPEGLGLTGEVSVFWNGHKIYTGAPRLLHLGIGAGSR